MGQCFGRGGAVFGSPLQQFVVPLARQTALHALQVGGVVRLRFVMVK